MLTAAARRARDLRLRGEAGVSLIELLMAMVLTTILGAITLTLFVQVDKATTTNTDRAVNTGQARTVLESWSSYLQVSDGPTAGNAVNRFEWFTSTDVAFYANLYNRSQTAVSTTGAPTLIWLRLDSTGRLVEEQFSPIPTSYPAAWSRCRIVVTRASVPDSGLYAGQIFTPQDSRGTLISTANSRLGAAPPPTSGCQKLPSKLPSQNSRPDQTIIANLLAVSSVAIDFIVTDTKQIHPLEFNVVTTLPVLAGST
jgi:Tfp pilus assembly protein PilV